MRQSGFANIADNQKCGGNGKRSLEQDPEKSGNRLIVRPTDSAEASSRKARQQPRFGRSFPRSVGLTFMYPRTGIRSCSGPAPLPSTHAPALYRPPVPEIVTGLSIKLMELAEPVMLLMQSAPFAGRPA